MTGREAELQRACMDYLERRNIYYINTWGNALERRGRPDLYICYRGWFVGCELKRGEGETPSPLQQKHLREIRQNGGIGAWITTLEELERLLCSLPSRASDTSG